MTTFATLVSIFYLCDAASGAGLLSDAQKTQCVQNYERLKLEFLEGEPAPYGTPERFAQNNAAYLAWKTWQSENAETVRAMKAKAALRLGAI